jgi:hypothetical protein
MQAARQDTERNADAPPVVHRRTIATRRTGTCTITAVLLSGSLGQTGRVRGKLRAMATEAMASGYRSPDGRDVEIGTSIRAAVAGTRLYLPAEEVPGPRDRDVSCVQWRR